MKGNPQLKLILRNINTEIEKTINALILVMENFKLRGIQPSVETVREALRTELNRSVVNVKRAFADFPEFMSYYIALCKDGTILNRNMRSYFIGISKISKVETHLIFAVLLLHSSAEL